MRNRNWSLKVIICALLALALLSAAALAAGTIDVEKDVSLSVAYASGETPISGAKFDVYRIADTDGDARMTATAEFSPLDADLNNMTQEQWQALAQSLKAAAQLSHKPMVSAITGADGIAKFTLRPGLYLVVGNSCTQDDVSYVTDPFLIFLPGLDAETDDWTYDVTAQPKNTQPSVIRKLMKIWDPDYPEKWKNQTEVQVDILCDGKLWETVTLRKANNWVYSWTEELDPEHAHDWTFFEHAVERFEPEFELKGTTMTITNLYQPEEALREIEIEKKITGSPSTKSEFKFVLKAAKSTNPMPSGSSAGSKTISVNGAGTAKFGEIRFTKPGEYVYTVSEVNGGVSGYTYDTGVYTLTYTVTDDDSLKVTAALKDAKGKTADAIIFTNKYSTGGGGGGGSGENLPQTGQMWWPVPVLLIAGLVLMLLGIARSRAGRDE